MNVYLDPTSPDHLNNVLFKRVTEEDTNRSWRYAKEYCERRNVIVNTIDFYGKGKPHTDDVYVALEHVGSLRKLYWRLRRNKNYPTNINLASFRRKVLIQGEPPMADPAAYQNLDALCSKYDAVYLPFKSGDPRFGFYQMGFSREEIPVCRSNSARKLLTTISANKSPRNPKQVLLLFWSGMKFKYLGYKELFTERIRAIDFFSRTSNLDLYGYNWNKPLPFPHWFRKKQVLSAYRGAARFKLPTLCGYDFSLVFENCELPSHISEKIFDCLYAGAIPVYWGAPDIEEYIPKNCFIHIRGFKNYEELRQFLESLTPEEIRTYRENGLSFLQSEKMEPFTIEQFAELFLNAVTGK